MLEGVKRMYEKCISLTTKEKPPVAPLPVRVSQVQENEKIERLSKDIEALASFCKALESKYQNLCVSNRVLKETPEATPDSPVFEPSQNFYTCMARLPLVFCRQDVLRIFERDAYICDYYLGRWERGRVIRRIGRGVYEKTPVLKRKRGSHV